MMFSPRLVFGLILVFANVSWAQKPWSIGFRTIENDSDSTQTSLVEFGPQGKLAAVVCKDTIRLRDLRTGRELRRLVGHKNRPSGMAFSPDGNRLVSVAMGSGGALRVWSTETGEQLFSEAGEFRSAVCYSPSGKYFAAYAANGSVGPQEVLGAVYLWNAETFQLVGWAKVGYLSGTGPLSFSRDGRRLLWSVNYINHKTWMMHVAQRKVSEWRMEMIDDVWNSRFSPDSQWIIGVKTRPFRETSSQNVPVLIDATTLKEVRQFVNQQPLQGDGAVSRVWFSREGKTVFGANSQLLMEWDAKTGELLWQAEKKRGTVSNDQTNQWLLESQQRQDVYLWNLSRKQRIARMLFFESEERWAVETADGYFDYSTETLRPDLRKLRNADMTPSEYNSRYHRPKIVERILRGMSTEDALRLPDDAERPKLTLQLLDVHDGVATLRVKATPTGTGVGIERVRITVDGREFKSTQTKAGFVEEASADREFTVLVEFPPGKNTSVVGAVAYDNVGQQIRPASLPITRKVKVAPVVGRLFVLAVGVSDYERDAYNLNYCHTDAEALAKFFRSQEGRAFGDVQAQVYTDQQATRTNVKAGLDWLAKSCTPADVAVVLFSGHGIKAERGLYYMTHEANINGLQYTCLNWETVGKSLAQTQAKQILFLSDACYAGSFGEAELLPQADLAETLRKRAGIMVFASSQGNEPSRENSAWGHGAFTKALLEGLSGTADINQDKQITVQELQQSVTARVIELTNDRQHPSLPDLSQFDPHLVIARVK